MPLTLHNVSAAAPDDPNRRLLSDVHLTFEDGTVTLLVGHTGSGKSTLLHLLAGMRPPSSGDIRLDDEPLWRRNRVTRPLLLRLGLTFQFPEQQLFARSLRQEFGYSLRPYGLTAIEKERRIQSACEDLGLGAAFDPDRSPFALSGGQRRRLALATTIATSPDWLLMDEPTAGLESAAAKELLRYVQARRAAKGGMIIATHDLDLFLPLADRVIVLNHGTIAADGTPAALCGNPEPFVQAGVGLPSCVLLSHALARNGIAVMDEGKLSPEDLADAIAAQLKERRGVAIKDGKPQIESQSDESALHVPLPPQSQAAGLSQESVHPPAAAKSLWYRLDPRTKWLLYFFIVIGTMLQSSWLGLACAALPIAVAYIGLSRSALLGAVKLLKPLAWFMLISVGLAGLEWTASGSFPFVGFSLERSLATGLNVFRLFLITLASYWFAAATPYGRMVQGLAWGLGYAKRLRLRTDSFALAVSLMFKFIPMIVREWQRFSDIVRARGKAAVRPGAVRGRDMPALVVPLLLALFHRAEEVTSALEMKKIGRRTALLSHTEALRLTRADGLAIVSGILLLGGLAVLRG
ncbi:energy-coupling factor transport system ATP-binding protein [Paenibacillus tianmuensis]|uniref:Energy-coupling factor transport system ATP-binding protein n=1 Tax=Paenibacillus tianmuensis TaxID=624147 RepID=A0A1G4T4C0_9BACL|nr:ATP-binding cassette domain-containing protein [Paenibacillus tianmuensis]SCW76258.1 energy-coupling factor transport system ATP-binding protein [Paenibacillus tianmuensis]